MKHLPFTKILVFILFLATFSIFTSSQAQAQILDDLIDKVKDLVNGNDRHDGSEEAIKLKSDITFALNGDLNNNGIIDAGDIIRFEYVIINKTNNELRFGTLDTKIKRDSINFIHNVSGTTGLDDDSKSIVINNVRIPRNMEVKISFDARTNYFTKEDGQVFTEPEFKSKDNKYYVKLEKISKNVKKISNSEYEIKSSLKTSTRKNELAEISENE